MNISNASVPLGNARAGAHLSGCRARIYVVEQVEPYAALVDARLTADDAVLVTSELGRLECRVKPLRDGNAELLRDYDEYFEEALNEIVPLTRAVLERATAIRAQELFKTPDAICLAAAIEARCQVFLTNYHRLDRFTGIAIEIVQAKEKQRNN